MIKISEIPKSKLSHFLNILKVVVTAILVYLVFHIFNKSGITFSDFITKVSSAFTNHWSLFLWCIILVPINWILEAIKWKRLTAHFQNLTFKQSFESILLGISTGIVTPGRVGEYGGRLLHIHPEEFSKALYVNLVSSIAQNLANLIPGVIAFYLLMPQYESYTGISLHLFNALFISFTLFLLVSYFNLTRVLDLKIITTLFKPFIQKLKAVKLSYSDLQFVFVLSWLRYFVYLGQYVLLLKIFDIPIDIYTAITCVALIYFIQSGLPMPAAIGVLARTQIAVFVISPYSRDTSLIMIIPIVLWLINLLFPSLLGLVVFFKTKVSNYFQNA